MKLWLATPDNTGRRSNGLTTSRDSCIKTLAVTLLALMCALDWAAIAQASKNQSDRVQLIMVEAPGCRFCAQWHADLDGAYASSPEAKFAPLVSVERDAQILVGLKPVTFTPTFIVLRGSAETGRISGYPGKDYFWGELQDLLVPLGFPLDKRTSPF